MPYVSRDGGGDIIGFHKRASPPDFVEFLDENAAEFIAYLAELTREKTPAELLAARMQADPVTRGLIRALATRAGDANENTLVAEIVAAAGQP